MKERHGKLEQNERQMNKNKQMRIKEKKGLENLNYSMDELQTPNPADEKNFELRPTHGGKELWMRSRNGGEHRGEVVFEDLHDAEHLVHRAPSSSNKQEAGQRALVTMTQ